MPAKGKNDMPGDELAELAETVNERLRSAGAAFVLFDRVRHATQTEGKPGVVTGVNVRPFGFIYLVTWSPANEYGHYASELELADPDVWAD